MCDVQTLNAIEAAVQEKVGKNEPFTAFDISRAAKAASGLPIRHRDVKHDVHDAIANLAPSYLRTLISISNVPERPFLYYPQGTDPTAYTPGGQSVVSVAQQQQAAATVANAAPSYTPSSPDAVAPDQRGRLWIPARFITGIGAQPGASVHVTTHDVPDTVNLGGTVKALRITTATPAGATSAVEYLVDRHSNIAISAGVLVDGGISGHASYKIEGSATEVVVKVA